MKLSDIVLHKFSKYLYGGVMNYAMKVGLTYLLVTLLQMWYVLAYTLTVAVLITTNFFYNFYITFRATGNKGKKFLAYAVFILATMIIDVLAVKGLTDVAGIHYILSIIIVTTVLVFVKFYMFERVIFRS